MKIFLGSEIKSNFDGYFHLVEVYHMAKNSESESIIFSFEETWWFDANLSAVLGAIVELLFNSGKKIRITDVSVQVKNVLQRNRFLCEFGLLAKEDRYGTIIKYRKFNPTEEAQFLHYIRTELLSKSDFPQHTDLLGKRISENIFELYENARTHGRCSNIHTCGQYFPKHTPRRMDITVVDMGRTIKANVNEYLQDNRSGPQTIEWAMQYGNTTKTGTISGGLGLDIIFEFIKLNKGKIQIISADGYWEYQEESNRTFFLANNFPGTIANIEFNLDDSNIYQLTEEISLDDIF